MVFWRKKKNIAQQEQDEKDEKLLHPNGEPEIEPSTDYEPEMDKDTKEELNETEDEILDELEASPVPQHTKAEDEAAVIDPDYWKTKSIRPVTPEYVWDTFIELHYSYSIAKSILELNDIAED